MNRFDIGRCHCLESRKLSGCHHDDVCDSLALLGTSL